jgi:hypothetical protein
MFLTQLWIPILVSAVLVFVASSVIHMVLKWHNSDYHPLPNEDDVRAVIRAGHPSPGLYLMPYCADMKDMATPDFKKKFTDGPVGYLALRPNGPPRMGPSLAQWFVLTLFISAFAAYLASKTLSAEASFGQVVRVTGLLSFLAYGAGSVQAGIWFGKTWPSVAKELLDALIYAAITGAVFCWLWPR